MNSSTEASTTASPSIETGDVSKIIEESRKNLEEKKAEIAPKKRGRPRKDAQIAVSIPRSESSSTAPVDSAPAIEIPAEILAPVVGFPFNIAAARTKFEGFKLSKEESEILAKQCDAVIRQYMPAMNSPHAAAIIFGVTFTTFAAVRYMHYLDWKKESGARNAEMLREVKS